MTLPQILAEAWPDGDRVVLSLAAPADHPAFDGHFPGQPVLPGVVQLDWAMRLAAERFHLSQRAARDFQVKYRRIIQPGAALSLSLGIDRAKGRLSFEYRLGDDAASTGRIVLEAQP